MATIALHYDAAGSPRLPDDDTLTGFMIDHAEALGWNQGFDEQGRGSCTWQINEAHGMSVGAGVVCAVQLSFPQNGVITPPWAGVAAALHAVAERWGAAAPVGYTWGFSPADGELAESAPVEFFAKVPSCAPARVRITVHSPRLSTGTVRERRSACSGTFSTLLEGAEQLLVAPPVEQSATAPGPMDLPEFHGVSWQAVAAAGAQAREWSPLLAGALANTVMRNARAAGTTEPVLLNVTRTGTGARRGRRELSGQHCPGSGLPPRVR